MYFLFAILTGHAPDRDIAEPEVQRLVRRARSGDAEAMGALYEAYVGPVFRAVRPMCTSEASAEDVVQDTFIKAFAALGRYQERGDRRFIAWLSTIGLNVARNRATRGKRRRELRERNAVREVKDPVPTPEDEALGAEARTRLLRALARLPERDREVLSLRYGAGLEASEVAAACGLEVANVRKICQRQRARLLTQLATTDGEGGQSTEGLAP